MNADLEQHCRLEIQDLESKGLIQKSRSPFQIWYEIRILANPDWP